MKLLNQLIKDEKIINNSLYLPGPYWKDKTKRASLEIKKFGISDFRGLNCNIGASYADNEVLDARRIYFIGLEKFYSFLINLFPFNKIFHTQLEMTNKFFTNYLDLQKQNYINSSRVHYLLDKYKLKNTVEFGCKKKFKI